MTGHGAVACGDPVTADAAAEILADGGTAFDAALAAMAVASVAEPVLCGLMGGGFLMARPADGDAVLYDFFCQTPGRRPDPAALDFHPTLADFGTTTQEFHIGMGAMAVPGAIAGLFAVHADLGRLPLDRLFEPAIRAARDGVALAGLQADILGIVKPIYLATDGARAAYADPTDPTRPKQPGQVLRLPDYAATLAALAHEGADLLYKGALGDRLIDACRDGGCVTKADLAAYRVAKRAPLHAHLGGADIALNPGPSAGGPLLCLSFDVLDAMGPWPTDAAERADRLVAAMALTTEARLAARGTDLPLAEALSTPAIRDLALARARGRATKRGGTTHISVIDADGNACALTLSNGEGNGVVLPGTGIMLNNMLGEEDINPDGFFRWRPNTRIASMMAPTVAVERDRLSAIGSGGSNRIRSAILQTLAALILEGATPQAATRKPRVHLERTALHLEPGHAPATIETLCGPYPDATVWQTSSMFFGGCHLVTLGPAGLDGGGDPRRGGVFRRV